MHAYGLLVCSLIRYHVTVVRDCRVGIDDGQKTVALASSIARPYQQIVVPGRCLLVSAGREKNAAKRKGNDYPCAALGCCNHSTAPETWPWTIVVETDSV